MKNLVPDFCRRQWISAEARALWEPRITSIGQQFAAAERSSLDDGVRSAALQNFRPEEIEEVTRLAAKRGFVVNVLSRQGRAKTYAAGAIAQLDGEPWDYRVAVTTPGAASPFVEGWVNKDDEAIGKLLGYPDCCRRFFRTTWGSGSVDPTWAMSDHTEGPVEANILLRWLGIRYVPHMPCRFDCEGSIEMGRKFRDSIPKTERDWMDALLEMPMLWSSLYGIGELVTPIVTITFRSEIHHELREIRREGSGYPELGADGLKFPYRPPPSRRPDERLWTDNGFSSYDAQFRAHEVVLSAAGGNGGARSVLDLGSGNGLLARKLAGKQGRAVGVESDNGRAARALEYLDHVVTGNLLEESVTGPFDLVTLMPGRLIESASLDSIATWWKTARVEAIAGRRPLLVYCYGDWLERYDSLEKLCHAAGLGGRLDGVSRGETAEAGMWRPQND